jgi:hypothetical protein
MSAGWRATEHLLLRADAAARLVSRRAHLRRRLETVSGHRSRAACRHRLSSCQYVFCLLFVVPRCYYRLHPSMLRRSLPTSLITLIPIIGLPCDVEEVCDGSGTACPPDLYVPANSKVCRAARGQCDVDERCDGANASCPPDVYRPASYECRGAAGLCDVAETCTGDVCVCVVIMLVLSMYIELTKMQIVVGNVSCRRTTTIDARVSRASSTQRMCTDRTMRSVRRRRALRRQLGTMSGRRSTAVGHRMRAKYDIVGDVRRCRRLHCTHLAM